jgi:hypothetical protein
MSTFLQYSPTSPLIDIDDVECSPIGSDMCGGRSLGLGICDFGVLLVTSQLGRFVQHIQIHLSIQHHSTTGIDKIYHVVDNGEIVFMLVLPGVAVWVSNLSHLVP